MEMRAYLEGIARRWWLLVIIVVLSFWIGTIVSNDATSQYTASTTILLNEQLITHTSFPSNVVQLNTNLTSTTYTGAAVNPAILNRISATYPWLSLNQLQKSLAVSVDGTNQIIQINMTSVSPFASADVANFIAQQFVKSQRAQLSRELNFYQQSLQHSINTLNNQVNQLNTQINALVPQAKLTGQAPSLSPAQLRTLTEAEDARNLAVRTLYNDQQAVIEIQRALPLVPNAFVIIKPASIPTVPTVTGSSPTSIIAIAILLGLLLFLIACVSMEFLTSKIRYKWELTRIVGIPVFAELPQLSPAEQKRLVFSQSIRFTSRIKQLRLLCALIGAVAVKKRGYTILLTSPYQKRRFATVMAMFLAHKGRHTLLIDANFDNPSLREQVKLEGPSNIYTSSGALLSFVSKTTQPGLFFIPADALIGQGQKITTSSLLEMLPILQDMFDIVVIDAPPMDNPDTHLLAIKIEQVLMLVKKRRDTLQELRTTREVCESLKLKTHYLFLT